MKYTSQQIAKRVFAIYALINLFAYVFAHLEYLYFFEKSGQIYATIRYYLIDLVLNFISVPVIASIGFAIFCAFGVKSILKFLLTASSALLFCSLPMYYLTFEITYGYDFVEGIILALAGTLATILYTSLVALIYIGLYMLIFKRKCKKEGASVSEELPRLLKKSSVIDFLSPENSPFFIFALFTFAVKCITEIVYTILDLRDIRFDATLEDILYIILSFIIIFILFIISYLISAAIKNKIVSDEE